MNKKQFLAVAIAALLVLGGISAYSYREAFVIFMDSLRDGDADGDGMPTRFEKAHGLDPLRNDSYEDLDGDAKFNLDEYFEGLPPNNPDHDGDHLADGIDRAPKDATRLNMTTAFEPGLLWAEIPLDVTRLECESRSATRIPLIHSFELGDWERRGCIESPRATGVHAAALHRVANTPWEYLDIDLEGHRAGAVGAPKVYKEKDGFVHYEIKYTGVRERFLADIANNMPTDLLDSEGHPYTYATFDVAIPESPAPFVTFELQGFSGHAEALGFDVRFYADRDYRPGVFEDRSVTIAQHIDGGTFQADIPLPPSLTPGRHVLFVMPFLLDEELGMMRAPRDFAIYNAYQRILDAIVLNTTTDGTPLLDGVPPGAQGIYAASAEELANYAAAQPLDLESVNKVATLVESFAVIGVIPDARVGASASVGYLESARLAGAKGIVVTHETGGKYHVATRSAALVNGENGIRLVTRSTSESFTKLPPRYAEYAGKGIVESSAHAVAVASEIGASAQTVIYRADGDTAKASLEKIRAGFRGSHTALDELDPRAGLAKTALRVAGGGLLVLDIIAMNRHWEEAISATDPLHAAKAWGLFISSGVSAAAVVLPFSPFVTAVAALIAIAAQSLLDPAFYAEVLEKSQGAIQAVSGNIPDSDQRAAFASATRHFAPLAHAANAPLFVGQFDDQGNAVTPAAFMLPQGKVGTTPQLLLIGLFALAAMALISRRGG